MQKRRQYKQVIMWTLFFFLFASASSVAHNLWIIGDPHKTGEGNAEMYFEHHVGPGDGAYNQPVGKWGKTWLRTPDGKAKSVQMKEVLDNDLRYFSCNTGKISGSYAIEHISVYGIYHGQLDFFHGRYIEIHDKKDMEKLSNSPDMPFQIVCELKEKGFLLKVLYFQKPYPNGKLVAFTPEGNEEKHETNKKGEVFIPFHSSEKYHFAAWAFEHDAAGEFEYEAYKGLMHGTTLTVHFPASSAPQ